VASTELATSKDWSDGEKGNQDKIVAVPSATFARTNIHEKLAKPST
jgi:hypothetical protein